MHGGMVRASIHFSWAICMRQDVALIACLLFFLLVGRVAGKEGRMRCLVLVIRRGRIPIN